MNFGLVKRNFLIGLAVSLAAYFLIDHEMVDAWFAVSLFFGLWIVITLFNIVYQGLGFTGNKREGHGGPGYYRHP